MEARSKHIDVSVFSRWLQEIQQQPPWRSVADKEADYYDGNQLDADILRRQKDLGIPPAIEPLIKNTIDSLLGLEIKQRSDFKVVPDDDADDDLVAEALNHKLNRAERHSHADAACSDAFRAQCCVGLGWVEVTRDKNPFHFGYRCRAIHRNEIFWDWTAREFDLSDARFLIRRKWIDTDIAASMWPQHRDFFESCGMAHWGSDLDLGLMSDGGAMTGLTNAWNDVAGRGWSIEEQEWRDVERHRVCIYECWYRKPDNITVIRTPDGRVEEYDQASIMHGIALQQGATLEDISTSRVRIAWWCGPYLISDEPSPYKHQYFPYVPFWGFREDRTGVPYGLIRGMIFLQDEVNARISKMHWLLAARATIRTDGIVMMDDQEFREMAARPDADIILDPAMAGQPGAKFEFQRNFELSQQQFQRLQDAREGIRRVSGITDSFAGRASGNNQSGMAVNSLIEQSTQTVTDLLDNFKASRMLVGDILLSMIIQDTQSQERVVIPGTLVKEDREIILNKPMLDDFGEIERLDNAVQLAKMKVTLEDVPSTPSFRAQQLASFSEAFKAMPPEFQRGVLPNLVSLMDIPNKAELLETIKQIAHLPSEEEIQQRIDDEVNRRGIELKMRELAIKEQQSEAQIKKLVAETVAKSIESIYSATQAGMQIASVPGVSGIADQILQSAGFQDQDQPPIVAAPQADSQFPAAAQQAYPNPIGGVERNTSPMFPPRANPQTIQPPAPQYIDSPAPDAGMNTGIEGGGKQINP